MFSGAVELMHAVDPQKGTYIVNCSVQGHRQGGMEGRITVT